MKVVISAMLTCAIGALSFTACADEARNTCEKPVPPNIQSSEQVIKFFNRRMNSYKTCIDAYVEERRVMAKMAKDTAQALKANDDAEAAIKEYNDLVDEINKRQANKDD